MRLLLDTHIFLWYISGDKRLGSAAIQAIRDPSNEVFLSCVSLWEVIIKHQLGKLSLPQPPDQYLPLQRKRHQIASLDINEECVMTLAALPAHHRDPFDRMLICQTIRHDLTIVTVDPVIAAYPVVTIPGDR